MNGVFGALVRRDLQLAWRRRTDAFLPVFFFVVAASLFPIGVGPEPQVLARIASGVVWVCALFAAMLSLTSVYTSDFADGSLEQMLLSNEPGWSIALAKAIAHWLVTGLPLVVITPLLCLLFGMEPRPTGMVTLTLLLGTPILSLFGGLGAALTLGLRSGAVLLILLILPLCIPTLIFGTGAVAAIDAGLSASAHLSLLGALLILALLGAPPATAAALRIAVA
jgi:heme exporter protein B